MEELGPAGWAQCFGEQGILPAPSAAFFNCPQDGCIYLYESSSGAFKRCNLDYQLKCRKCKTYSAIRLWKRDCQRVWHSCDLHKAFYYCNVHCGGSRSHSSQAEPRGDDQPVEQLKRSISEVTQSDPFEAMQAANARRARREVSMGEKRKAETCIQFNAGDAPAKRPSLLGPKLEQRFPASASSSCRPPLPLSHEPRSGPI